MKYRDRIASNLLFLSNLVAGSGSPVVKRAQERYERALYTRMSRREVTRLVPLERVRNISPEAFYENYYRKSKPVILEGIYEHWPALQKWNMSYFRTEYGERSFEINVQSKKHRRTDFREMSLARIIDSFETPESDEINYLMFSPVLKTIPELREDIDLDTIRTYTRLPEDRRIWVKLFLGPAYTKTALHMAPQCNLFFQVYGDKRWVMFPPEESPLIYANKILPKGLPYFFSDYGYKDAVGDDKFPLTDFLEGYDIHLRAGDALYVPPFHWHWVQAQTPSISLSSWWYDSLRSLRVSPFYFALSLPGMYGIWRGEYDVDQFDHERSETIKRRLRSRRASKRTSRAG